MLGLRLDSCVWAWGLALTMGGCDPAATQDPSLADADRLVPQLCESAQRCLCADDLAAGECLESRTELWNRRIDEGRSRGLTYDAACFEAQVEAAVAVSCQKLDALEVHPCESYCAVFHGSKEEGSACQAFDDVVSDCAQGLVCSDGRCSTPCERLTGLPFGAICRTEEGSDFDVCALGLQCDYETRSCIALPAVGQACDGACEFGASCNYQTGTCVANLGEGGDCRISECAEGLYCEYDYDGLQETATCRSHLAEGQACANGGRCDAGLGCGSDGVCRPPADVGQSCAGLGCAAGLLCNFETDVCLAPPEIAGQQCLLGECGGGLWCDTSMVPEGVCQVRLPLGERCAGHSQCESDFCPNAFCFERPGLGEDCSGTGVCVRGLACDGTVCVDSPTAGPAVCSYLGW